MKKKQHWLDETYIGELINNAADGWGRIFLGEKSTSKTADPRPQTKKKVTRKVKKT